MTYGSRKANAKITRRIAGTERRDSDRHPPAVIDARGIRLIRKRVHFVEVTQVVEQIADGLVTFLLIPTDGSHDYRDESGAEIRIVGPNRGWILRDALIHYSKRIFSIKGSTTTEHFIQEHANRIDIGASPATLSTHLFRCQIIGRSHYPRKAAPCHATSARQPSNAKIDKLHLAIGLRSGCSSGLISRW